MAQGSVLTARPSPTSVLSTGAYDTKLSPDQEAAFQAWRATLPAELQNTADYDLRGAFLEGDQPSGNAHLTDAHKKPNHMTYSDGSVIRPPGAQPGHWEQIEPESETNPNGVWQFNAGASNLQFHTPDDLLNYFQAVEANKRSDGTYGTPNRVVLPRGTR